MNFTNLQKILDKQPSVSGNTYFVSAVYVLSWILMVSFFVLALGLLLESTLHFKIFLDWVARQLNFELTTDQRFKIATSLGWISLFLSAVFGGMIYVAKMVLVRNHFIIEIEDWIFHNIKEIQKKPAKSKK